ncbi:phosphatidylglycerophosphate synthase [Bifidobacterium goeldii]|uniref:Phosphatidylglycerophosphate synthase n=1 Tax=Bifidobacterium goeldii TaxID=2306975 RepID=A0A430FLV0_9BIFI|nr:CDP-alcohol phosphatidyltransferase family protein [Bifidobacterium goeldii]RSX53807.1 phosphatidylglycerophosphate synthase [Bifidobacterium goeldii]
MSIQKSTQKYRNRIKERFSQKYSPEPRDIYFTVPNLISVLRIASIPVITWLVARHQMVPALIVLAVSSITDSLDGIIARACNQVSKIGQLLDPIADRLLIICSVLALGLAGIIPWWMIIIIAARDVWMLLLVILLAQYDYGPLPVHFVGKAGTFMLMVSIVALIFCDIWTNPLVDLLHLAAMAAGVWGVGLYWVAGYIYSKQGLGLLIKEKRSHE